MKSIEIDSARVAIFSDIHWGKSRDSEVKLQTNIEFMEKFIQFVKDEGITDVIFGGDWFDNRNVISVKTINRAYDCLKKLAEQATIYMIVGNHDAYFKETIEVNSIRTLADIEGVVPIEELTEVHFTASGKVGLLCPWNSFNSNELTRNYDAMFGHFEFQGAVLKGAVHHSGEEMSTLTNTAPLVFSGHFHIRKEYPQKNGKVITVGSPVELDWGDSDNLKGHYTLDVHKMEYDFFPNDFSPRHIKIYWSKLKRRKEKLNNIKGNYVKLIIDEEYKFEKVMKVLNIINAMNPVKPCQTDFIYNNNFNNMLSDFDDSLNDKVITMSKLEYINKFVDHVEDDLQDLDKRKLLAMINEYYQLTSE